MARDLRRIKLVLLDLDGTVYLGHRLLPGAREFFRRLAHAGIAHALLTNNSSIGPDDYLRKLRTLGLKADRRAVITSAESAVLMLRHHAVRPDRLFVLGTGKLVRYVQRCGFGNASDRADAVLVGFDKELTYEKLTRACHLIRRGATLYATHPDVNCPMPEGAIPDAGSLLALIRASTGVRPRDVAGKPHRWIVKVAQSHFGLKAGQMMVIGDRLDTDVRLANRFGLASVLISKAEKGSRKARPRRYQPDLTVSNLAELIRTPFFRRLTGDKKGRQSSPP